MALYSVHCQVEPLATVAAADRVTFVKLGFSWAAFFWGSTWLLGKKLWAVFFVYWAILIGTGILVVNLGLATWALAATWAVLHLWLGVYGAGFVGRKLEDDGLPETTFLEADSLAAAECRFFGSLDKAAPVTGAVQ